MFFTVKKKLYPTFCRRYKTCVNRVTLFLSFSLQIVLSLIDYPTSQFGQQRTRVRACTIHKSNQTNNPFSIRHS